MPINLCYFFQCLSLLAVTLEIETLRESNFNVEVSSAIDSTIFSAGKFAGHILSHFFNGHIVNGHIF